MLIYTELPRRDLFKPTTSVKVGFKKQKDATTKPRRDCTLNPSLLIIEEFETHLEFFGLIACRLCAISVHSLLLPYIYIYMFMRPHFI